jgi:hypothetical protein
MGDEPMSNVNGQATIPWLVAVLAPNRDFLYWKGDDSSSPGCVIGRTEKKIRCNSGEVAMHLRRVCWDHASGRVPGDADARRQLLHRRLHAAVRCVPRTALTFPPWSSRRLPIVQTVRHTEAAYVGHSHMSSVLCKGMRCDCGEDAGPMRAWVILAVKSGTVPGLSSSVHHHPRRPRNCTSETIWAAKSCRVLGAGLPCLRSSFTLSCIQCECESAVLARARKPYSFHSNKSFKPNVCERLPTLIPHPSATAHPPHFIHNHATSPLSTFPRPDTGAWSPYLPFTTHNHVLTTPPSTGASGRRQLLPSEHAGATDSQLSPRTRPTISHTQHHEAVEIR